MTLLTWFQFGGNFLGSLYLDKARAERDLPRCSLGTRSWTFSGTQPSCRVPWHSGNRSLLDRLRAPWSRRGKEAGTALGSTPCSHAPFDTHLLRRNSELWLLEARLVWGNPLGMKGRRGVDEPFAAFSAGEVALCIHQHRTFWQLRDASFAWPLPENWTCSLWGLQICGRTKNALANLWTKILIN